MTSDPLPATSRPRLDELLMTMGITPEELSGMTADDLFAAATQWQDSTATAAPEGASQVDILFATLQEPPATQFTLN